MEQYDWSRGVLWTKGFLDEGLESRIVEVRYLPHGIILEGDINYPNQERKLIRRGHVSENHYGRQGPREGTIQVFNLS